MRTEYIFPTALILLDLAAALVYAAKCDPTRPEELVSPDGSTKGVCITCLNGIDDWWYAVKIIPVEHGLD